MRVILTVSPVPLVATYEDQHVLVANTFSKSILRVAAERVARTEEQVAYFPSYEIVTSPASGGCYFGDDARSVTEAGVAHVMRVFQRHYMAESAQQPAVDRSAPPCPRPDWFPDRERVAGIVCDELLLDAR